MDHRYQKFLILAETKSFSLTAKRLHVSQPAITIAIASLELKLGKKLLIRNNHKIELTPYGETVLTAAKKINKIHESMIDKLEHDDNAVTQVGFIDSIAHLLYTSSSANGLLSNIEAMVDNSVRILNDLLTKKIDFGFITGQLEPVSENILVHKLHDEQFVFVTAKNSAPVNIVNEIPNWLAFNKTSTTYKYFVRQFKKDGLNVRPIFYSTSMELLKDMAKSGNGIALLPKHFVANDLKNGTLSVVKTKPMYRPIWIVTRKSSTKPKLLEPLTKQIDTLLSGN
jgi:DNA-binding transcriptional LysR family regulator